MFLEFTRLPNDYVVEGRDAADNEYSVFGPSAQMATIQALIQKVMVIAAVGSVPVMLFIKPFYLRYQHKKKMAVSSSLIACIVHYICCVWTEWRGASKYPDHRGGGWRWGGSSWSNSEWQSWGQARAP